MNTQQMRSFVVSERNLDPVEEANFLQQPVGPSSQGCCKVSVPGACGSGSLVGYRNGNSLVLTNKHVTGRSRTAVCEFPFLNNRRVQATEIMSGYSNQVMMDWSILELAEKIDLPHVRLNKDQPRGEHYTAGYPRCVGPRFQRLTTRDFLYNGTVWRWTPNAIGGQSGSGVHSIADNCQYGLLTWSWGGLGAGQTALGIWRQYTQRAAVGYPRPEGLEELMITGPEYIPPDEGFFEEANITTLDIWAHMQPPEDPETDPDPAPPPGDCGEFAAEILSQATKLRDQADVLIELARRYGAKPGNGNGGSGGPTFGL